MRDPSARLRTTLSLVLLALLTTACTGGINAGEKGGTAFIALTVMLLAILGILWLVLGRED
ncbi:hypothetical protein BH24ACT26_BH24ACT26_23230 [soil metagenome]